MVIVFGVYKMYSLENFYTIRKEKNGGLIFKPYEFPIEVNNTGYEIILLLKEKKSFEEIADFLSKKYNISKETARKDLANFLEELGSLGVLFNSFKKQHKKNTKVKKDPIIKIKDLSAPLYVSWDCTNKCNLRCIHCYSSSGVGLSDELSTEEAKNLIEEMAENDIFFLHFLGGEPLLRHDLFELDKFANKLGVKTAFNTNGTLITRNIERLKKANFSFICVSILGSCPETHDKIVRKSGAFKMAIEGIKSLVKEGFEVYTVTVVTQRNYKEIPELIELFDSLGVKVSRFQGLMPSGRGEETFVENGKIWLSREEFEWCKSVLEEENKRRKLYIDGFEGFFPHHYWDKIKKGEVIPNLIGCPGGLTFCHVSANGKVYPCAGLIKKEFEMGDLRKEQLIKIWKRNIEKVLKSLKCHKCNVTCTGECRQHIFYGDHGIYGTL